ncbi:phosphonate ABC transporter ATP-binding protein [Sandarakinorhabdus sp.]|uniref:phosphonate ABC transporter ATP-binding protein n=1 Tax=Sandarakinorhabdus sp. TaxID=1916663 RepID=UPI003F6F4310
MLELKGLSKRFGETVAVDNVSLKIPAGAMVGVIGRSGAGKSTLLRLINRLCDPTAGEIMWHGTPVGGLNGKALREWRARCGMVFQQFNLSPRLDVMNNVLTGSLCRNQGIAPLLKMFPAEERARAILELHALDMADAALQRCCTLSGGQQQRVAIARTLMQMPDIILADEPIASLDPANAETVMETLARINRERGITVLVNLHALDIARRYCPRIIGMAQGRVVFDGSPDALHAAAVEQIYGRHVFEASSPAVTQSPMRLGAVA